MIQFIGIKNIKDNKCYKDLKKILVIILMIIVGLSGINIPLGVISIGGISLACISGILLNLILNILFKDKKVDDK